MSVAQAVINHGLRPLLPSNIKPEFISLMKSCWLESPLQRPTFDEIVVVLRAMNSIAREEKRYADWERLNTPDNRWFYRNKRTGETKWKLKGNKGRY